MKLILFSVYILMILTVIFVERKRPTEALLWVLVMVCIPYGGTILYLIFGSTVAIKLTAWIRKKRLCKQPRELWPVRKPFCPSCGKQKELSEEDRQVIRFNTSYNGSELTGYEKADLYTDGISHYTQLFRDIREAKTCIFIEFYTIHHDVVGKKLIEALTARAAEGVQVWVMCDFIANLSTPEKMFAPLREAGGKVIRVKPYLTHYRSHRKIVSIDHRISYIGGMNIGKQYAGLDKVKTPWRDTQVRMEGACTAVLDEHFLRDWLCAVPRKDWKSTITQVQGQETEYPSEEGELCQFIIGGADNDKESVKMCYLSMIRSAKKKIRIQTPYFIPDVSVLDALKAAAASGVEIELMIPGVKASFFLDPVTNYYCGQLFAYGMKVYKYRGYIHAKTMVIDEELCCIGSVNLDMRSLMVDDEVCGVFYSNALVQRYGDIFEKDKTACIPYTWEQFQGRGQKEKILESIFLLFAPLM